MRVFVLGIDGLTFRVLDPLIEEGYLPNFLNLKREGAWGILKSTVPPITPAAWMSIATGLRPAKHGVLDFLDVEWVENQINLSLVTRRKSGQAIWEVLSNYDRQVAVVNVPCTYPPDEVNGVMISGFSAPSLESSFTYPHAFQDELFKAIPDYQIDFVRHDRSEIYTEEELLSLVRNMTDRRVELLDLILRRKAWDFIFFTFVGPDRLQHELWDQIIEGKSPKLIDYYRTLDSILGRVMNWIGDDGVLLVVSDHGFRGTDRVCYINQFLHEQGLVKFKFSASVKDLLVPFINRLGLSRPMNSLYTALKPQGNKEGALTPSRVLGPIAVDRSKMWALAYARSISVSLFCQPSLLENGTDNLIASIVAKLRAPGIIADEIYTGKALRIALGLKDEAWGPKAILMANAPWAFQGKPRTGLVTEATKTVGIHDMDGCLLAWGKGVKPGNLVGPTSVFDIAPTILYALDLPMESDFDGHPLTEMFTSQRRIRIRDKMTGAVWEETRQSDSVRKKIDKLLERD
jgi:predicted AlkP superfamily phosphohydrolase/phosphomutase